MLACTNNTWRRGLAKNRSAQCPKTRPVPQVNLVALHRHPPARPKRYPRSPTFQWRKRRRMPQAKTLPASTLWMLQPLATSEALPAQIPLLTVSCPASVHLSTAMLGTGGLICQTERSSPEWRSETAVFMTRMVGFFNPSLDAHRLTTCSRVPLKGVGSLLGRCSSQTATGEDLMESVDSACLCNGGMDSESLSQMTHWNHH